MNKQIMRCRLPRATKTLSVAMDYEQGSCSEVSPWSSCLKFYNIMHYLPNTPPTPASSYLYPRLKDPYYTSNTNRAGLYRPNSTKATIDCCSTPIFVSNFEACRTACTIRVCIKSRPRVPCHLESGATKTEICRDNTSGSPRKEDLDIK